MLVRTRERVIVKTLDAPVLAPHRDIVEARDGEAGLGVGRRDETFLWEADQPWKKKNSLVLNYCRNIIAYLSISSETTSDTAPRIAISDSRGC